MQVSHRFSSFQTKKNGYNIQTITSFVVNMCLRFWSLVSLSYFVDNRGQSNSTDWIDVSENIVVHNLLIESTTLSSVTSLALIIWALVEWTRSTCIKLAKTKRELTVTKGELDWLRQRCKRKTQQQDQQVEEECV